ncbi:MAG: hypothetical protein ABII18_09010 [bacterium]|nr:hypothetical protein [bacterium]MBU1918458.1 hypothetical protein [bacterium]
MATLGIQQIFGLPHMPTNFMDSMLCHVSFTAAHMPAKTIPVNMSKIPTSARQYMSSLTTGLSGVAQQLHRSSQRCAMSLPQQAYFHLASPPKPIKPDWEASLTELKSNLAREYHQQFELLGLDTKNLIQDLQLLQGTQPFTLEQFIRHLDHLASFIDNTMRLFELLDPVLETNLGKPTLKEKLVRNLRAMTDWLVERNTLRLPTTIDKEIQKKAEEQIAEMKTAAIELAAKTGVSELNELFTDNF